MIQINNTPDATEEEKQEATNRVNAGLAQAIQNINNAHSTQEVNESKQIVLLQSRVYYPM